MIANATIAVLVFLSGFVMVEPSPSDLLLCLVVAVWAFIGLRFSRSMAPMIVLMALYCVGGFLSFTQLQEFQKPITYMATTVFLAISSIFYCAVIQNDTARRLAIIEKSYIVSAVICSIVGILGYFGAIPHADLFTLYDRAKGAFKDPNVFGPFLIAPALYLVYGLLTGRPLESLWRNGGLLVIVLGIFLSFSRAAWALFLFCACLMVFIMLLKERTGAFRLKILVLSLLAVIVLFGAIVGAMQSQKVSNLFSSRAQLEQDYDAGHLGRFERHRIGFLMSMEHPLGIGPMTFSKIFPEDEHNIWLKSLTTYGWIGFISYITMMIWTLSTGFKYLLRHRDWQPYLMISWIVILGHVLIGNVIDTDHWRHFYLLLGIVWGCRALEMRHQRNLSRSAAIP